MKRTAKGFQSTAKLTRIGPHKHEQHRDEQQQHAKSNQITVQTHAGSHSSIRCVCVCVSSVWTATENPPGTRQSLIRANKGGRFASPNNLIILISRFRWSAAGPQCARFVVIARFYASDTQVTRRVWHPRSSCTVAQRSPSARGARRRKKLQSFLFIAVILKVKLMSAHLRVNWVRLRYGNYCRGGAEMSLSPPPPTTVTLLRIRGCWG